MRDVLAAGAAAGVVFLAACGGTLAIPTTSGGVPAADSPAVGLRAHLTLLYGEHTYVIAKLAVAASAGRKDEYASYARLLAASEDDETTAVATAAGQSAGDSFRGARVLGDGFFVDYTVAATTQQKGMADTATMNLNSRYMPQMAQVLSSVLNISTETATRLVGDEVATTRQFIDDDAAGNAASFYPDLRSSYAKSTAMGGSVAEAIAWKYPDKYPGDATGAGAKLRSQLDAALQEHAFLLSMATDAAATGATADSSAAMSALEASTREFAHDIGSGFGANAESQAAKLWGDEDASFLAYASATDDASKAAALNSLNQTSTPGLASFLSGLHVTADIASVTQQTIGLIDDQRARSYGVIAAEDRQAAALQVSVGDLLMKA
jgi:hypothetical protein